jgi:predicted dehydrogenase
MRIALIGLGVQGRKRRAIAGDRVTGTVDPAATGADRKSIDQLPPDTYDAAFVCVPDPEKLSLVRYLLAHRKHVLVEKPLLGEAAEIRELIELSRANGVSCYTAYNHRFEPHLIGLKRVIEQKTLGRVYLARFFYGNGTARDVHNSPWRDKGLGVFSDLGSHLLDMALFLFGPTDASGKIWTANHFENKAPDHVLFGFEDKPTLEMEATLLSWRNTFSLDVYGELGSAHIHCLCKWGPSTLTIRKRILPSGRRRSTNTSLNSAVSAAQTSKMICGSARRCVKWLRPSVAPEL